MYSAKSRLANFQAIRRSIAEAEPVGGELARARIECGVLRAESKPMVRRLDSFGNEVCRLKFRKALRPSSELHDPDLARFRSLRLFLLTIFEVKLVEYSMKERRQHDAD